VILILFGAALFPLLGFHFSGTYEYIVFAFMIGTGLAHWYGLHGDPYRFAEFTASVRAICASLYLALYMAGSLDGIALLVGFMMPHLLWCIGYFCEAEGESSRNRPKLTASILSPYCPNGGCRGV
jgi:hypothetical protein